MTNLRNRANYEKLLLAGGFGNTAYAIFEIGKALDWCIERAYEIGVTHDPSKCWNPPNRNEKHLCPIRLECGHIDSAARQIAMTIDWKGYPMPFDIYGGHIDLSQTDHMLKQAVFIQDELRKIITQYTNRLQERLYNSTDTLICAAAKTHVYAVRAHTL